MTLPNLNALEAEWAVFMENKAGPRNNWTQDQRWRFDNPGEMQQLQAYRDFGAPRPVLATVTGRRMVFHLDAWLLAKGDVTEPGWPPVDVTPPVWVPARTVVARSAAEFATRYAQAVPGDLLQTEGEWSFTTQVTLNRSFADPGIEIRFANTVSFKGDPTPNLNAVFLNGSGHRIMGGRNITNPKGHGILIYPGVRNLWHDLDVGPVGGSCLRVFAVNGDVTIVLDGVMHQPGGDLSLDPHRDPGSGLHPSYIGGDETQTGTVRNSRFVIDAHDCATGSNQIGGKAEANEFYYRAKNLTYEAHGPNWQIGGNAAQLFGAKVRDNRIWVEADNVAQVVNAQFLSAGSTGNVVWHGRGTNVRLQPAYTPSPHVTYQDCT